ncbi:MAG: alcohol dehydrogenase-like regulatory protein ErcA [Thermodesulfobacteriota bacterium]
MDFESDLQLRKFVAPEFIFGLGALELAGRYAKNFGASRILIVTDPGVMAAGWTDQAIENLELEGLPHVLYSGVTPNPRAEEVMRGAEVYKNAGCNLILAVGGGSPMDCAKGIGIVSTNKKHILEFEGVDRVSIPMPPLICIPTTGGTSADVSQFAIISNPQEKIKIAIISKAVVPDVALIDPHTLTTMDPYLAACTGLDALVHAIEAYVSLAHSPITDLHALAAIRLLCSHLLPSLAAPGNLQLRSQVMLGSLEAGLAFSNASLGAVHAMAHSLGGLLDLPHGECNAILLEHVMSFNFPEAPDRFSHIGEAMGLDLNKQNLSEKKAAILGEVMRLRKAVGIEQSLGQKGVQRTDIPELSQKAMNDPCIVTNPRRPVRRDIEVIFEEAL